MNHDPAEQSSRRAKEAYPPVRFRVVGPAPVLAEKYERYEATSGEVTLADTDATVLDFSGTPDCIEISARSFGAIVTLTDRLNREGHVIVVHPNSTRITYISRMRVVARNLTGGSNALLSVVGKWAAPGEPV